MFSDLLQESPGWRIKDLSPEDAKSFVMKLERSGIGPVFDHMPYLPNLASPKDDVYSNSVATLTTELLRCDQLHIPYLVTHMGSHLGAGKASGLKRIVKAINSAFSAAENSVMLLLENTAGTKNSMGGSFGDIAGIIDALDTKRVGVCLDTCHLFAAGYELRTPEGLDRTIDDFDSNIDLQKLKLVHLNDSKGGLGSRTGQARAYRPRSNRRDWIQDNPRLREDLRSCLSFWRPRLIPEGTIWRTCWWLGAGVSTEHCQELELKCYPQNIKSKRIIQELTSINQRGSR